MCYSPRLSHTLLWVMVLPELSPCGDWVALGSGELHGASQQVPPGGHWVWHHVHPISAVPGALQPLGGPGGTRG